MDGVDMWRKGEGGYDGRPLACVNQKEKSSENKQEYQRVLKRGKKSLEYSVAKAGKVRSRRYST